MCDAIMGLVEVRVRERERIAAKAAAEAAAEAQAAKHTKILMEALDYTADEAMALLEVPEWDRVRIARLIGDTS